MICLHYTVMRSVEIRWKLLWFHKKYNCFASYWCLFNLLHKTRSGKPEININRKIILSPNKLLFWYTFDIVPNIMPPYHFVRAHTRKPVYFRYRAAYVVHRNVIDFHFTFYVNFSTFHQTYTASVIVIIYTCVLWIIQFYIRFRETSVKYFAYNFQLFILKLYA